jgi:hypothetical protein
MSGQIRTTCLWGHLIEGLKKTSLLRGVISERDTIESIVFTTPDGETIEVPEGSKLELCVGLKADMYAIGIEHEPGSFGMTHGPHFDMGLMLEVTPEDSRAVIFCFGKDGSERKTHKVAPCGTEWEAIAYDPDDMMIDPMGLVV